MGHVPSKEASSVPFLVDLQGAKGGIDRLMAVALTQDNFPSVDHPLFKQFVALRCDPSVLHWFNVQDPNNRTEIPAAPSAEVLYEKHVLDVNEQLVTGGGLQPDANGEICPIPICLFRIVPSSNNTHGGLGHQVGGQKRTGGGTHAQTSVHEILEREEVEIVGYVGMRGPHHTLGPILSVFLDKSLWNEAKSISIFQIASKCYEHFSRLCGIPQPRWPSRLQCRALETNLPTLRLIQKITREYQRPQFPALTVDHVDQRVSVNATPQTLLSMLSGLAASVYAETWPGTPYHRRFCVLTQRSFPNEVPPVTPFDDIVDNAKRNWGESNALVVAAKKEAEKAELVRKEQRSIGSTTPPDSHTSTGGLSHSSPTSTQQASLPVLLQDNHHAPHGNKTVNGVAGGVARKQNRVANKQQQQHMMMGGASHNWQMPPPPPPPMPGQQGSQHGHGGFAPHPPLEAQPQQVVIIQPPPQAPTNPTIKLPFETAASILLPTGTPGVLQPFPIKWCETDVALKPSSQCSQHPGMLLELRDGAPASGSLNVIGVNGVIAFVVPEPCYINLAPGAQVFVE